MRLIKKRICVIGLGYIGLPTAAMFATHGHIVNGVDVNPTVVEALNRGEIVIEEPYLDKMVQGAVISGKLSASDAPSFADVFIIAVPTPINEDKTADMSYVRSASESIVPFLKAGNIVILESTSPPGTVMDLLIPILSRSGLVPGNELLVAHSPERVLPGRILMELVENNRIIGGINDTSCKAVKELYSTFVKGEFFLTDATTAEMCKLVENTFRDVNIALANELSLICETLGINAWEVIKLSNKHPRVEIHQPGPGVGGHCLAVDPWFIVEKYPKVARLISLSRNINDNMPHHVYERINQILGNIQGIKKVVILGITYKPDIDDIRESPIIELLKLLKSDGQYEVVVVDEHVKQAVDEHVKQFEVSGLDIYEAASGSHLVLLGVNHTEFARLDFKKLRGIMAEGNVFDTRNFFDKEVVESAGLNYFLLGSAR